MDKTQKIIIVALIAVIAILGGLIATTFMKEPVKTVELFENGTTIQVPASTNLTSQDAFSTIYSNENTRIIGVNNNNLVGALATKVLTDIITENGEKQENGLYKLDKTSIMKIGDQFNGEYNEQDINEAFIGIKHNNTVNQSIIIIGTDENEILDILDSIQWKLGVQTNSTVDTETAASDSTSSNDQTFPFYADDGGLVGYYHVGDVIEHYDGLYQLKSNGEWVYIGEAPGSSQNAYDQGYSDAIEESNTDDEYYDDEDSETEYE